MKLKKLIIYLLILAIQLGSIPGFAFAQEPTPSATLSPDPNDPVSSASQGEALQAQTEQAIQQLPDLGSTTSGQFNYLDENGVNSPYPVFSNPQGQFSATTRVFPIIRTLSKRSFRSSEDINVIVDNAENQSLEIAVYNSSGEEIDFKEFTKDNGSQKTVIVRPFASLKPGKYKIKITTADGQSYEQDFTWGVLAINTNKSIYLPSETAKIAMAVLDEKGEMVCDANVELRITNQELGIADTLSTSNGRIKVNPECQSKSITTIPDYEASYAVSTAGIYNMNLLAITKNGSYSITDSFEVRDSVLFDVERKTATRIYPPNQYPVELEITASQDFTGTVAEVVPANFVIEQAASSSVPFKEVTTLSETSLENVLGASVSANLHLPFDGEVPISNEFGEQVRDAHEKKLYARFNLAGHDGVDFDMPTGTRVLAADDGEVVMAGGNIYGTTVVIAHTWGRSYYGHLSEVNVTLGQKVSKGEEIALSGNTGITTGPHLHFGIKPSSTNIDNGYYGKIDPLPFLGLESSLGLENKIKLITWDVSVKKGDKFTLSYNYTAPNVSPQLYKLGPLRFYENGEKIFQEIRQWQIAVDAPNNQFVYKGDFTKRSGTGTQSETGVGFKPKAVIFYWTNQTADGTQSPSTAVANAFGMGFAASSSEEAALSVWDEAQNAAGATDNGRATYNNASIVIQGTSGAVTFGIADFTSFDPDGFTLNWSTSDTNLYVIHYIAFSETIISNAAVGSFSVPTSGATINENDLTFTSDLAFFITGGTSSHGVNTAEGTYAIGAAQSSSSEWTVAGRMDDAVDSSDTCTWQRTDATIALIGLTVACGTTTEDALVDFTTFQSDGFDLNVSNNPSSAFDVFYLALKGSGTSFNVGSFNKPTATGLNSVSISNFQPAGLMFASRELVSSTTVDQSANGIFSFGATSGKNQESAFGLAGDDAEDAYDPSMRMLRTKTIVSIETDADTVTGEANLASFDASGFTLNWTTADATADEFVYWAIGEALTPSDLMRHGKWFNEGVEKPFAF